MTTAPAETIERTGAWTGEVGLAKFAKRLTRYNFGESWQDDMSAVISAWSCGVAPDNFEYTEWADGSCGFVIRNWYPDPYYTFFEAFDSFDRPNCKAYNNADWPLP